jgi:ribosomal protein S18 acetylase RimI-like enzyme
LVELAIGEARRRRLKRLIAVVHEQNRRAQRFFESVGFEPTRIEVPGFVHLARLIHQAESAAPLEIQP